MAANPKSISLPETVRFTLNGEALEALADETILQAAKRVGIEIPYLCYKDGYRADGNCRACMVEIKGERVLAPACCRKPSEGMEVSSDNERARHSQTMILELLLSDMPGQGKSPYTPRSELDHWAEHLGLGKPRFPGRKQPRSDLSHPAIAVNLDACIQCTRCVRACREEQVNDVIGYAFRGAHAEIVFDLGDPMGVSTCVACGECVQACPTGALMPANNVGLIKPDKQVASTCPYCGVGCLLTFNVKDNTILYVDGRDGPANHGRLCVKGRYGFDYVHHPDRLTKPLVRREGAPKTAEIIFPEEVYRYFREATWEEALDFAAGGLRRIRDEQGPQGLAGFGCAKGSNEEAYLFQKCNCSGASGVNLPPVEMCGSSEARLRDVALEGVGEGVEEIGALLAQGVEVRAEGAEGLSAREGAKAAGDLLLDFGHAHSSLSEVVSKGNPGLGHEAQHIVGVGAQPVEQIDGLALPRAAALARRRRAWIGGLALGDDLQVEGREMGDAILGQRAAYPFHLLAGGK